MGLLLLVQLLTSTSEIADRLLRLWAAVASMSLGTIVDLLLLRRWNLLDHFTATLSASLALLELQIASRLLRMRFGESWPLKIVVESSS